MKALLCRSRCVAQQPSCSLCVFLPNCLCLSMSLRAKPRIKIKIQVLIKISRDTCHCRTPKEQGELPRGTGLPYVLPRAALSPRRLADAHRPIPAIAAHLAPTMVHARSSSTNTPRRGHLARATCHVAPDCPLEPDLPEIARAHSSSSGMRKRCQSSRVQSPPLTGSKLHLKKVPG